MKSIVKCLYVIAINNSILTFLNITTLDLYIRNYFKLKISLHCVLCLAALASSFALIAASLSCTLL